VDRLLGEHDLVVRRLDPRLGKTMHVSAASVLPDGSPILILDAEEMLRSIESVVLGRSIHRVGAVITGAAPAQGRRRILVVDDSITVREVQRKLLSNRGYLVDVAVDGSEGWNAVRQGRYDLVITDLDMPRMNGIELVTLIKQSSRFQGTPVIIVSYKDREEDRAQGLEAGANYYLTKGSFRDDSLLRAVVDLIGEAGA
jgi:two-component system sensor histidine kinase and response regulator WspE